MTVRTRGNAAALMRGPWTLSTARSWAQTTAQALGDGAPPVAEKLCAPRAQRAQLLRHDGADEPLVASQRGAVNHPVNQLRDPCVFEDEGRTFLFYAVAGESGIGVAELIAGSG